MSTRSERLARRQQGESARKRVLSGQYNQQPQPQQPQQNSRLGALAAYDAEEPQRAQAHADRADRMMSTTDSANLRKSVELANNFDRSDRMMSVADSSKLRAEVEAPKLKEDAFRRLSAKGEQNYQADKADEKSRWDQSHGRNIPVVGRVLRGVDAVADFTKPASDLALEYYTPGAGMSVLQSGTKAAGALVSKVAPGLGKTLGGRIAKTAATEAIVGAPVGVGSRLARDPEASNKELLQDAAYGAAGGALLGGLGTAVSGGIRKGVDTLGRTLAQTAGELDAAVRSDLPQTVRRVTSTDRVPEVFPERFRRTVGEPISSPLRRVEEAAPSAAVSVPVSRTMETPAIQTTVGQPTSPTPTPAISAARPQGEQQMRGFAETLLESDKPPQGFKEKLKAAYTPVSNEQTLKLANRRLNKDTEEATSFVMGNSRFTAEKAATAQRLIDHYNNQGNFQRAVDVAQKVSEEATRAGQSIQALSMFNRLTAEGILIHAQRIAKKTNEAIPIGAKEVKVTEDMAASISGLAQITQKMSGVADLSNNVIEILERAKGGAKLSETETQALKRFVNESRQFVEETTKKAKALRPPRQPKDKRVRDNVMSFLEAQEQAAKERLRARGIRVSSTPLDVWADYAVIGASKMGRGTIKFTDWAESMVKDLGESIRPVLHNLYERSRETFEASTKKISSQTIDRAEQMTGRVVKDALEGKRIDQDKADSLITLARKVSNLSGEEKRIASQDLQLVLQELERPGILKRVSAVQTIGQLLNPKTHVRNSLGNELFYRLERLNKYVSTPIDIVRSKLTGGERTVTFRTNNQGEYWSNWMRGLKAGWKGVSVNGLETQYDLNGLVFKSKYNPLRYMEKTLGAALKSFDTAAYMRAYNDTIGEMATLRAINEGSRGNKALIQKYIREADDNVLKIADEYGRYVTLQDKNVISTGLSKLKRGLNLGKDFGAGDLIIKYPKTPGALLMRALEYSPAGFVRSAAILARPIFKREPNTAEVTQALSRAIIGTAGLSGMGYFLLDKGILTGASSKDKDIRDLQRAAGQGQYQVNMSALMRLVWSGFDADKAKIQENDFLYTYDWMQPVSMAISIGANTAKNISEGKKTISGVGGTIYNSVEGGLGTLTEQSVLSGLRQAAEGYPGQTVTDKIMDILSTVPSSFVPTLSNQSKQLQDNNRRETYAPNKLRQSLNVAQSRLPNVPLFGIDGSKGLPQQYDTLGRPKQQYQDNSVFNVMFNPGFGSRYQLSPEAKFIVDLIEETGDESLAPRVPGKTITIDGQSVKLNGDMFSRLQQLQGEETRAQLQKRIQNDSGKKLETRAKNVSNTLTEAGKDARKQLEKEMGSK